MSEGVKPDGAGIPVIPHQNGAVPFVGVSNGTGPTP